MSFADDMKKIADDKNNVELQKVLRKNEIDKVNQRRLEDYREMLKKCVKNAAENGLYSTRGYFDEEEDYDRSRVLVIKENPYGGIKYILSDELSKLESRKRVLLDNEEKRNNLKRISDKEKNKRNCEKAELDIIENIWRRHKFASENDLLKTKNEIESVANQLGIKCDIVFEKESEVLSEEYQEYNTSIFRTSYLPFERKSVNLNVNYTKILIILAWGK